MALFVQTGNYRWTSHIFFLNGFNVSKVDNYVLTPTCCDAKIAVDILTLKSGCDIPVYVIKLDFFSVGT